MEIIYCLIGIAVGAAAVYLAMKSRISAEMARTDTERKAREYLEESNKRNDEAMLSQFNQQLASTKQAYTDQINQLRIDAQTRETALQSMWEKRLNDQKTENETACRDTKADCEKRLREQQEAYDLRLQQTQTLNTEQREKEIATLRRSYEEQLALFKEQVTTATEQLLRDRSDELQKANTQKMDELFKPVKENIDRMERSITENREANARNTASFEKTIQQMMESNTRLSDQADRLSTALQRKNKTAGNWGELILSELLQSQGLEEGVHFDVQQSLKDDQGKSLRNEDSGSRMIPDVVLHLADNRDVVVDSKMSLTAYIDYQNADNEEERADALRRHIASVQAHIKELSGKNYSEYIAKTSTSIDFVIMFVPIEGALMLAMTEQPQLWREAFDKKVFVAGAQTLIAALRIIDLTWVNVKQERNTAKVMDEARKLIDRVGQFYGEFKAVGRKLEEAAKAYSDVAKRVDDSSQSILATGRRMEALGARGKKALPGADDE